MDSKENPGPFRYPSDTKIRSGAGPILVRCGMVWFDPLNWWSRWDDVHGSPDHDRGNSVCERQNPCSLSVEGGFVN